MRYLVAISFLFSSLALATPVILKIKNPRAHELILESARTHEEIRIPSGSSLEIAFLDINDWEALYASGIAGVFVWNTRLWLGDLRVPDNGTLYFVELEFTLLRRGPLMNHYTFNKSFQRETNWATPHFKKTLEAQVRDRSYLIPASHRQKGSMLMMEELESDGEGDSAVLRYLGDAIHRSQKKQGSLLEEELQ